MIVGEGAHPCGTRGAPARPVAACSSLVAGRGGLFTADEMEEAIQPRRVLVPADVARRGREHAQPRRRARLPAGARRANRRAREARGGSRVPRRRAHLERGGRDGLDGRRALPRRSTRPASASRRGSARRSAARSAGRARSSSDGAPLRKDAGAAGCARWGSSRRPRFTRSSITARGSPTITRTRASSPSSRRASTA